VAGLVKLKYVKDRPICHIIARQNNSPAWKDLIKIRHIYLKGRRFKVGNGKLISFWLNTWMGEKPLSMMYPIIYELAIHKDASVFDIYSRGWVIQFSVRLPPLPP
jgi:hypothetical protein